MKSLVESEDEADRAQGTELVGIDEHHATGARMGMFGVGALAVQTLHPGADAADIVGNLT
jgi:hypothetical protein